MSFGGTVFEGISKLFDGPLGVVQVAFEGFDLGKTTADTLLTPDQDVKDILYQQDGTKAADHVRTGIDYILNVTFGEIKTGLLVQLMSGLSSENTNPADDAGTVGRSIYQSMRDLEAGVLRVGAVDENGVPLEDDYNTMWFYEAIPIVNGDLVNWGADTQRNLPVQFRIKWHRFSTGESTTKVGAFGYWGDPTGEDVPAVVWPDVAGPVILTAEATDAVTLEITFDENIAFVGASFSAADYVAKADDEFFVPTNGVIASALLTLTFPASTFVAGDVIRFYMSGDAIEDLETTPNVAGAVNDLPVTNSVP
jgi:hypothetical protein